MAEVVDFTKNKKQEKFLTDVMIEVARSNERDALKKMPKMNEKQAERFRQLDKLRRFAFRYFWFGVLEVLRHEV